MPSVVVLPATPLLVRGAAGAADPLAAVRDAVREVLRGELGRGGVRVGVLGTGPRERAGRLRPSLAAAGIAGFRVRLRDDEAADAGTAGLGPATSRRMTSASLLPDLEGVAATGPSVALLALADAGVDLAASPVDVVEVPGEAPAAVVDAVVARLRARTGPDLLVVADHPAPGVDAVVAGLTAGPGWERADHDVPQEHEHLPPSYRVTVLRRD